MKKVAIVMGSKSDAEILKKTHQILKEFGVESVVRVLSAHRTPQQAAAFAKNAAEDGFGVIICAAGKAAHLAGVIAGHTILPVIGLPILSSTLDGLDSLLSTVQMPGGVPVATVAINGAENAAILAVQILSLSEKSLQEKLYLYKQKIENSTLEADSNIMDYFK
ncbi:5-(carboxyamino)imidazole ribonucleotide mutase [bacterium]|nr:5-(carboxyamino)imidazole ribonucleotide mutase [bacterium]